MATNMLVVSALLVVFATVAAADDQRWFEQRLDHFDYEERRTWNQRYFQTDSYYRPGGPAFLQIGGEGPASAVWLTNGHWIDIAKNVGAKCFILEHRFYGESHPTADTSVENLRYLSSEQALSDLANFISNFTATMGLKRWIVFGGSYPGSLSIWARLKYPHLIHGAMSASAPLFAKLDFFEYNEVVNRSLTYLGSPECVESINTATKTVQQMLTTDAGRQQLQKTFNLCQPLKKGDDEYFQNTIADAVAETVQYNRDNRAFEGATGGNVTISVVCDHMTDKSLGSEVERYATIPNLFGTSWRAEGVFSRRYKFSKETGTDCVDASYDNFIETMKKVDFDASRTWVYQTCTEFGWFQSTDSMQQPFKGFPVGLFTDMCEKIYGSEFNPDNIEKGIEETNFNYGSRDVAHVLTNTVLFNGGVDPWHAMSYVGPISSGTGLQANGMEHVKAEPFTEDSFHSLFVPSAAHCAIMYPDKEDDPPELTEAKRQAEKYITQWVL